MLIIFGIRARARTIANGRFYCSRCGADRSYVLQQIRRWFTLFFVPLFPISKSLGEQVKCTTCGQAFRPEVLNTPTSADFGESLRGAVRVASMSMLAAGDAFNPAARTAAVNAARQAGAENYDDTWVTHDLAALDPSQLAAYLEPLTNGLNPQGKETFVEQIARIGLADGPLSPGETHVLDTLGATLGLSAAHVRGIIVSTVPQPSSGDSN